MSSTNLNDFEKKKSEVCFFYALKYLKMHSDCCICHPQQKTQEKVLVQLYLNSFISFYNKEQYR